MSLESEQMTPALVSLLVFAFASGGGGNSAPKQGSWKLVGTLPGFPVGKDSVLVLLEFQQETGGMKVQATGIAPLKGATARLIKRTDKVLEISLQGPVPIDCFFKLPGDTAGRIPGAFRLRGDWFPCALEQSTMGTLDGVKLEQESPGSDLVDRLRKSQSAPEKIGFLREVLATYPGSPSGLAASGILMDQVLLEKSEGDLKEVVAFLERACKPFPFPISLVMLKRPIMVMCEKKWHPEVAEKLLASLKDEWAEFPARDFTREILKMEAAVFPLVGKSAQGQAAREQLEALEQRLDAEFEKAGIPFPLESKSPGGITSDNPAVIELFTGAQGPTCVGADVALDALGKSHSRGDLLLLRYHLHIPGPDPLVSDYSETRARFYGARSTPTIFLNGQAGPPVDGNKTGARAAYDSIVKALDGLPRSAKAPQAILRLAVSQEGNSHFLTIRHDKVAVYRRCLMRPILVEEKVRYQGRNGHRLHGQVVRAPLGDAKGLVLAAESGQQVIRFELSAVRKQIELYWDRFQERRQFLDEERPLELGKMAVVVLLQDIDSKEIIQAARVTLR